MTWRDLSDDELAARIEHALDAGPERARRAVARDVVRGRDEDDIAAYIDELLED